ncbi:MFS transporter [Actibacterium pelagium]|uniref:MFS transporter n=1 Tax=Actibacterium pelagium TaxID=2029103 RepID=A0A917AG35_9RHOB|nr:MFS transporter [Actibacterium pelagium]GGE50958.1 MFS transporter [Actibacterium pelagium]
MSSKAPKKPTRLRHIVFWCMYDWGNSSFPAVILSFVFAPYFLSHVAEDAISGEAQWGFAISASAIIVAFLSPVFGSFADRSGRRRPWLGLASFVAILATAAMWNVMPAPESALLALFLLAIANAAFELAYVFYNAILPRVASEETLGRISGFGWGAGYLGSLAALGVVMLLFIQPDPPLFGLDLDAQEPLRATALFTALWFLLFAAPLVFFGPPERSRNEPAGVIIRSGLKELWQTIRGLRRTPSIAWFLVAHMLYIDGVNTLFVFGPLIAVGYYGFEESEILLFGVTVYLAAGLGAFGLGWLDDHIGAKRLLLISLMAIVGLSLTLANVDGKILFWSITGILALFFGPVQSSSRSLMARLAPEDQRAKLFGLYALAGRAIAPFGPAAVSAVILATGNQRAGIVVVACFLLTGALVLLLVQDPTKARTRGETVE